MNALRHFPLRTGILPLMLLGLAAGIQAAPLELNFTRPPIESIEELPDAPHGLRSTFTITLNFGGGLSDSQKAIFAQAKAAWEARISGYQPGISLDGFTINASSIDIDGEYGVLGRAGPTHLASQAGYLLTTDGIMEFDSADLDHMEASGYLQEVIEHEMGHVLGIGTLWDLNNVYVKDSGEYTGEQGLAEWQEEFQPGASWVPVELDYGEGTANGHWDENPNLTDNNGQDMEHELMTGHVKLPTFVSQTTIHSLQDLGYAIVLPVIWHDLQVTTTNGGTVTLAPQGSDCGTSCYRFVQGTVVTLTAQPDATLDFAGWSGDCSGPATTCILTLSANRQVEATFSPIVTHTLSVTSTGTGAGTVTAPGIDCGQDCTEAFREGTTVTLTAVSAADSLFTGWSGACAGSGDCTVILNTPVSVSANFDLRPPPPPPACNTGTVTVYADTLRNPLDKTILSEQAILTKDSIVLEGDRRIRFQAGNHIELYPGFEVRRPARFAASVAPTTCK